MNVRIFWVWLCAVVFAQGRAATVDTLVVASRFLDEPMTVTVAVPSAKGGERFPTVYLLNGYSGNHTDYARNFDLGTMADRYGAVIVCPDGRDSWYWDSPAVKGMQMESFIIGVLIPRVEAELPVKAECESRAIAGLSMGGHGALYLAARHPDLFGSAASMSGAVDMTSQRWRNSFKIGKLLGDKPRRPYSARYQLEQGGAKGLNIYIACGESDPFAGQNADLHKMLTEKGIEHEYVTAPGGHTWDYWRATLPGIMDFFQKHMK